MANLISIVTIGAYFIYQAPLMMGHLTNPTPEELKQFDEYMTMFGKRYRSEAEKEQRFIIYKSNLVIIDQLNKDRHDHAEYGETIFTDLTINEFTHYYMLPHNSLSIPVLRENVFPTPLPLHSSLPQPRTTPPWGSGFYPKIDRNFVSWREGNPFYPPVEDQGQNNLCAVFSVVGGLSILYSVQQKKVTSLSKQQYIDCVEIKRQKDGYYRNDDVLEYVNTNYLAVEAVYPFRVNGSRGECDRDKVAEGVAGLAKYWTPGTRSLDDALKKSPVVTTVMGMKLQHYTSGIIADCPDQAGTNFAVVIVEHGVAPYSQVPYYLLRTSWGPHYGIMQGHVKIQKGKCGIGRIAYALKLKTRGGCFSGICDKFRKKN